jgi:hypothetical protein
LTEYSAISFFGIGTLSKGSRRTESSVQAEFFERYQQLPTFECVFENGIAAFDAVVVNQIVTAINERKPEFDLKIDSFHSRGFPHVKFTVKHQAFAEEAESIVIKEYETQVRMLEDQRDRLEEYFELAISQPRIAQEKVMGDQYINNGQSGVVGPNGEARDFQQAQTVNRVVDSRAIVHLGGRTFATAEGVEASQRPRTRTRCSNSRDCEGRSRGRQRR